jgi:hypothetical protein
MKFFLACTVALIATAGVGSAQSPAATESKTIGGKTITIAYNSPRVNRREGKLFGKDGRIGQDPTYPVWRAGANSATKFHTDADLDVGDPGQSPAPSPGPALGRPSTCHARR